MLVFIDESGCPGFKIEKGSDPIFAVGMIIFKSSACANATTQTIRQTQLDLGIKTEFKFSKCDTDIRDRFFHAVVKCEFSVRAIIVKKQQIYSPELRKDSDKFYNYFVKQLMNFDGGALEQARIRLDGSGGRDFQRALGAYLRRELGGKIRDFKLIDSARDPLIQLADMCIGAIARSYRDRQDPDRWRKMLTPRIDNIWEFK